MDSKAGCLPDPYPLKSLPNFSQASAGEWQQIPAGCKDWMEGYVVAVVAAAHWSSGFPGYKPITSGFWCLLFAMWSESINKEEKRELARRIDVLTYLNVQINRWQMDLLHLPLQISFMAGCSVFSLSLSLEPQSPLSQPLKHPLSTACQADSQEQRDNC